MDGVLPMSQAHLVTLVRSRLDVPYKKIYLRLTLAFLNCGPMEQSVGGSLFTPSSSSKSCMPLSVGSFVFSRLSLHHAVCVAGVQNASDE